MKLTIAIPTVNGREQQFEELYDFIIDQCKPYGDDVEVIYLRDNKEISIGKKRQKLTDAAIGEYITMADDDDFLSKDYVYEIMNAIKSGPDCVGFEISCTGTQGKTASASNRWPDWKDNFGGFDYVRTPYHKTPIRRDIVLQIGYEDRRYGEDYFFSKKLKESGLIKTEVYIPKVLYFYRFKYENPKTKFNM